jgi:hypothetical protein
MGVTVDSKSLGMPGVLCNVNADRPHHIPRRGAGSAPRSRSLLAFLRRGGIPFNGPVPLLGYFRCQIVVFDRARTA